MWKPENLRILGVNDAEAFGRVTDIATYAEAGYPVEEGWVQFRGIFGRKEIPKSIQIIERNFSKAIQNPSFQEYMLKTQQEERQYGQ
jgi:tripartite-type tricarboxylate transporter receptor subunit TctC